jgi:hypothetical protein
MDSLITTLGFRRLLHDLKDKGPNVCIRYRLLGEMWADSFMQIVKITEKGALFRDHYNNRLVTVSDLQDVMQFEIDNRFQEYQPHYHYEVKPVPIDR